MGIALAFAKHSSQITDPMERERHIRDPLGETANVSITAEVLPVWDLRPLRSEADYLMETHWHKQKDDNLKHSRSVSGSAPGATFKNWRHDIDELKTAAALCNRGICQFNRVANRVVKRISETPFSRGSDRDPSACSIRVARKFDADLRD